ncbi:hypothetical protein [Nitrosovibrio sp. Nv17]|uniref:hypothetical protein n=1 Tax=Nitrosovibrio sp. Nv17 TaxID=1855339 RepID=UPI00090883B1|nr:hypothetical protein [Nitrosovibrio sp. Nv17]SFW31557.1 hypothetical protein SAMN05216414_11551 [Nitrosovibrio sp. Nv17]
MDENRKIIIRHVIRSGDTGTSDESAVRVTPASRWAAYLLFIPVLAVMAILGVFFFTAFLALFAVTAAAISLRLWWLRRKLRQTVEVQEGEYSVIEDVEILEEHSDDPHAGPDR